MGNIQALVPTLHGSNKISIARTRVPINTDIRCGARNPGVPALEQPENGQANPVVTDGRTQKENILFSLFQHRSIVSLCEGNMMDSTNL